MALPDLTGEITLKDNSSTGFQSFLSNAERANRALTLTGDQVKKVEGYMRDFGLSFSTATQKFADLKTGLPVSLTEALERLPKTVYTGVQAFDSLHTTMKEVAREERAIELAARSMDASLANVGKSSSAANVNALTEAEGAATEATSTLKEHLATLGAPAGPGIARLLSQLDELQAKADVTAAGLDRLSAVAPAPVIASGAASSVADLTTIEKVATESTANLQEHLAALGAPAGPGITRLLSQLDELKTKADATAAGLDRLTSGAALPALPDVQPVTPAIPSQAIDSVNAFAAAESVAANKTFDLDASIQGFMRDLDRDAAGLNRTKASVAELGQGLNQLKSAASGENALSSLSGAADPAGAIHALTTAEDEAIDKTFDLDASIQSFMKTLEEEKRAAESAPSGTGTKRRQGVVAEITDKPVQLIDKGSIEGLDEAEGKATSLHAILQKINLIGQNPILANSLPGAREVGNIARLVQLLPEGAAGAAGLAVGLGGVAAVTTGVVVGFNLMANHLEQLEVSGRLKQKIGVTFDTKDVDSVVADLQDVLGDRVSKEDIIEVAIKVDKTSALADIEEFGTVAKIVQGYSRAFGLDWKTTMLQVEEAINKSDGAFLESAGFIDSAQGALQKYALEHHTTVKALTDTEKQQALLNAVIEKMGPIATTATTPIDKLRDAQDHFKTVAHESATAFGDWIAGLVGGKSLIQEVADRIEVLTGRMESLSDLAFGPKADRQVKAGLDEGSKTRFDGIKAELEKIRVEERAIAELGDNASTSERKLLQDVLDRLEERRQVLQTGIDKATAQVKAGETVSPLPEPTNEGKALSDIGTQAKKIETTYTKELTEANLKLDAANKQVAASQTDLRLSQEGQTQAVLKATDASGNAIGARQAELETTKQQIEQMQALLANPPKVATPEGQELQDHLAAAKAARADYVNSLKEYQDQLNTLGKLAASGQAVQGFDQQLAAVKSSSVKNVVEMEEQNKKIADLTEERSIAASKFQAVINDAVGQGFQIPTGGGVDEQMKAVTEATGQTSEAVKTYQYQLGVADQVIGDISEKIKTVPAFKVNTDAVGEIQRQLDLATQSKTKLETEINALQQQMAQQGKDASSGSTAAVQAANAALSDAQGKKAAAAALIELLTAEKSYLAAHQQLLNAQVSGDINAELQALHTEASAKATLDLAQNQAKAAQGSAAYAESIQRVSEALGQATVASGKDTTAKSQDDFQRAIDAFQGKADKNPIIFPTVLAPPKASPESAPTSGGTGDAGTSETLGEVGKASDKVAESERHYNEALHESISSIHTVSEASNKLLQARLEGNAALIKQRQNELALAEANSVTADAATRAAAADFNAARAAAAHAVGVATVGHSASGAASAVDNYGKSVGNASSEVDKLGRSGGVAVDAVSRLPIAFSSAGSSAEQLKAQLQDLEGALQDIQFAATNAAFSIAQQLVPSMGIAGSLQQGSAWAEQAGAVKDSFEQINAARESSGQDPLGAQVLDTAMNALTSNWRAYATDTTASLNDASKAGEDHAKKMEKMASQVDKALDGMVKGVLTDSTKGLIPQDTEKELLPREDAVDEKARRMADVAVKGFKSPWFAGLKDLFPQEVLAGGEGAIRKAAAEMVRAHQEGLSTMLFDADAAAQKVVQQLQGKQNMDAFVAQVREKVKALGKDVKDLDIEKALGIDPEQTTAGGGGGGHKSAQANTLNFQQIIEQMKALAKNESPIVGLMEPKEEGKTKITKSGKDAADLAGGAIVSQSTEGKYGEKAITAINSQLKTKEADIKDSGRQVADWLGGALLDRFSTTVPAGLLDILVDKLGDRIEKSASKKDERTSGGGKSAE